jgi:hypothetical protein
MGEMGMKKILSIGLIGVIGVMASCMQLEYMEISDMGSSAHEEISSSSEAGELSSSSSSSSSENLKLQMMQIGRHELAHRGISYYEAILICNKMSLEEGLDTLYQYDKPIFTEDSLFWLPNLTLLEERSGYRLPTKEEWVRAMENGEIEKLDENVGEWLYGNVYSQYSVFELAPGFLKTVGLYREREGYPVYGMRVVISYK